jgi:hypothetical protein
MDNPIVDQCREVFIRLLSKCSIDEPRTAEAAASGASPADLDQEHVAELGIVCEDLRR